MWVEKLEEWNYPKPYELAPILEELGLNPEDFQNPLQLGLKLRQIPIPMAWWDPIIWFFQWLWEIIKPYAVDIGLITLGGFMTMILSGWYKVAGLIPLGYGLYDILKRVGVI